jgi:hypothetical protein
MRAVTKDEIAEVLDVDAVVSGQIRTTRLMTDGAAAALSIVGALVGADVSASTNEVDATISIHDGRTGELLWQYEQAVQGNLGSSPEKLTEYLMRRVSKKLPYPLSAT